MFIKGVGNPSKHTEIKKMMFLVNIFIPFALYTGATSLYCHQSSCTMNPGCISRCEFEFDFCLRGAKTMFSIYQCTACQERCQRCCYATSYKKVWKMTPQGNHVKNERILHANIDIWHCKPHIWYKCEIYKFYVSHILIVFFFISKSKFCLSNGEYYLTPMRVSNARKNQNNLLQYGGVVKRFL